MVFCRGCGKEIHETARSCPRCGATQLVSADKCGAAGTLWLPVPALIMGILAVLALFDESSWDKDTYIGMAVLTITAIVLAGCSLAAQTRGRGMAITAIVLGVIGLLGLIGEAVN